MNLKYLNPEFALKAYKLFYENKDDSWEVTIPAYMEHFHKDYKVAESVLNGRKKIEQEIEEILSYKTDRSEPRELEVDPFLYDSFENNYLCILQVRISYTEEKGFFLQGLSTCVTPCCGSEELKDEKSWIDIYAYCIPIETLLQIIEQMQLYKNLE